MMNDIRKAYVNFDRIYGKYLMTNRPRFEMRQILLNGRAGAGKDTLADFLHEYMGHESISLASGIYNIAYGLFGMTTKDRKLLQDIGQKMREIDSEVWIKDTLRRASEYSHVVVPDVRQANEYLTLTVEGYIPIRISADLEIRKERIYSRDGVYPNEELLENASENGADDFTFFEIDNNGTVEDLLFNFFKIFYPEMRRMH